jgi:hypothetical protein
MDKQYNFSEAFCKQALISLPVIIKKSVLVLEMIRIMRMGYALYSYGLKENFRYFGWIW